jgi:exodeoxyribonuclease-3
LRIATWNVNSIKAHMEQALRWLKEANPDVVCLQEIKCEEHGFPAMTFEELGYKSVVLGQKTWNGVAILSKLPMEDVVRGLPGEATDEQARYIQATVFEDGHPCTIGCIYLPNGNPPSTDKYPYKLRWMERLLAHARQMLEREEPFVLAGDYNVIPARQDAKQPELWVNDALFLPATRERFRQLTLLGLTEAVRALHPADTDLYSFYDYQAGAWQKGNGIRIDHLMLSPQAADRLSSARIDQHVRGWDKPSDHVPVVIELQ